MFEIIRRFLVAGIGAGIIAGNSDEIKKFYDDITQYSALVATSGDMRSLSLMLDYHYLKKGRYPSEKGFSKWAVSALKENSLKNNMEDHWGNPYLYKTKNRNRTFTLISTGGDGIVGTGDDIMVTGP